MKRFKSTDSLGNVAYIHFSNGWRCTLANGIPASLFYALGNCDEMAVRFALEDAADNNARLKILRNAAGPNHLIEMV